MMRNAASNFAKRFINSPRSNGRRGLLRSASPSSVSPSEPNTASHRNRSLTPIERRAGAPSLRSFADCTTSNATSVGSGETSLHYSSHRLPPTHLDDREERNGSSTRGSLSHFVLSSAPSSLRTNHRFYYTGASSDDDSRQRKYLYYASSSTIDAVLASHGCNSVLIRRYHATPANDRAVAIAMSLGAVAATAKAGQLAFRAFDEWKASLPAEEEKPVEKMVDDETADAKDQGSAKATGGASSESSADGTNGNAKAKDKMGGRENFFAKLFNFSVGSKYYEGGFEDVMTRREAALILGVRESSTPKRIKEAHRNLLILNHPDTGGSTYMSLKINQAKELLLKGKRGM